MFSGIIEATGTVVERKTEGTNVRFVLECPFAPELRIDQSVAHDGVCLTVVALSGDRYEVVAVDETLQRTTLGQWAPGRTVNLERSLRLGDRLDGHLVQGHVDATGTCTSSEEKNGSWSFRFSHPSGHGWLTVPKGSITVNGVSLTVVESGANAFSVAIIPYTFAHTTFRHLTSGDPVNLEFDILGKYFARYAELWNPSARQPG